jgi:hypothetical protein
MVRTTIAEPARGRLDETPPPPMASLVDTLRLAQSLMNGIGGTAVQLLTPTPPHRNRSPS